jgi:hypothetical protein
MKMDLRKYQQKANDYDHLSLRDLLDARELYHVHLMRHPNVVATAVGRYRIRRTDDWPTEDGFGRKGTYERTLANSEVRPYSWPSVLVFVDKWEPESAFKHKGHYNPDDFVPKTLYLPDGRRVPVCVIRAPRVLATSQSAPEDIAFPTNNVGGGYPILADVQGREFVATIACLVTDGHKTYALTNHHVAGGVGEELSSELNGERVVVGHTAAAFADRLPFTAVFPDWPGAHTNVNIDAGLIDIDNLDGWSAQIRELGIMGPLADLASDNFTLSMCGCQVIGHGAASGVMRGEIAALFYRYKSVGGFEFVADFLIGPRATRYFGDKNAEDLIAAEVPELITHPGDSGTLWLLEPMTNDKDSPPLLPLAMQWGAHVLETGGGAQTFALATSLSTICRELGVDIVRDWNLDQPDTWGAVGHFAIASRVAKKVSKSFPRLAKLMRNNALVISHKDQVILTDDFKHMGDAPFVALADVPDFFWKHGNQGFARPHEGPNHFADMDESSVKFKGDLLKLTLDPKNIDPDVWNDFYDSVVEPPIAEHRGLLPFRVWQIFDEMISFVGDGDRDSFVCAAGVLTHYVGDACQPLHISRLHHGDPDQPGGSGVHDAYETKMVNANRKAILDGLDAVPLAKKSDRINNGFEAAVATIELMRLAFTRVPPADIVAAYMELKGKKGQAAALWQQFGTGTVECMQAGAHVLAQLWQSAWELGGGETKVKSTAQLTHDAAMKVCQPATFLPSFYVGEIGALLKHP